MNLKDAFPRPTPEEVDSALVTVWSAQRRGAPPWHRNGWRIAAVIAGLLAAYAAGFASGRQINGDRRGEAAPVAKAGDMTIRPPVLVAGPRS